ncbi:MAG: hypothetical protein JW866_10800, partial [Ignavibacteriales bacterium]|nr:hypothetical protein [Ignavibacteriales bacterium]
LNTKVYAESGGSSMEVDIDDMIKSTDFGLLFGAGIDINIGSVVITLDGRYNFGLTDLNNNLVPGYTFKTNAIQILAGVGFAIK